MEWAFPCDRCRFKTSTKIKLDKHVIVKNSPLPRQLFPCDQCDYLTPRKSNLNAHKLKHADGRPFACHQCEKSFKRNCELLVHTRVHSGEGSLQCVPCDKTFVTRQLMKRHNRSVSHRLDPDLDSIMQAGQARWWFVKTADKHGCFSLVFPHVYNYG